MFINGTKGRKWTLTPLNCRMIDLFDFVTNIRQKSVRATTIQKQKIVLFALMRLIPEQAGLFNMLI